MEHVIIRVWRALNSKLLDCKHVTNLFSLLTGIEAVRANIEHLKKLFKTLEDETEMDLENARVHIKHLVKVICSLPTEKKELHQKFLDKFAEGFKDTLTITVVFLKLGTHTYWDYLNTDILEHIITEFSLPSQTQLEDYKRQQQQFMKQTTVEDFCEAEGGRRHIEPPPAFVTLISKHEWEPPTYLKKVDDFRKKFAHQYDLRESAVILVGMRGGSVVITMMVPESVVAMVNSTDTEFFKEHGIVHLQLSGTCVYKQASRPASGTCSNNNDIICCVFPDSLSAHITCRLKMKCLPQQYSLLLRSSLSSSQELLPQSQWLERRG